jgi:protein FrlC
MPGDGRFPLAELLEELAARGYTGRATIELVTAYINEPSLYARRAIDRVRALMPSVWRKV